MLKRNILLIIALSLIIPFASAHCADGDKRQWDIRIQPVEGEAKKFIFEASFRQTSRSPGGSSGDEVRVPKMIVVPGKESKTEIKAPDGSSALTARVLINEKGTRVTYSVVLRTGEGTHSSSADLALNGD